MLGGDLEAVVLVIPGGGEVLTLLVLVPYLASIRTP